MGILGNKNRLCAALLSASFLLSVAVLPGCAKKAKADPDPQIVSNHDSLEVLPELLKKTESAKYIIQGEISKLDGKTEEFNSFKYEMKEFINALLELNMEYVDDWDPDKLTYPVYEFCLESFDSTVEDDSQLTADQKKDVHLTFEACWSNGYLITASGDVLKCDTDFEKLCECLGERFELDHYGFNTSVFGRVSALWHDKWYPENMMSLEDYLKNRYTDRGMSIEEADRWKAEFKSRDTEKITVTITNVSASELIYGDGDAIVFTKFNGKWYLVPADPSIGNMMYPAIGYCLFEGQSVDQDMRCGYLPKGDYAVLVDLGTEVTAEFQYDLVEFTV